MHPDPNHVACLNHATMNRTESRTPTREWLHAMRISYGRDWLCGSLPGAKATDKELSESGGAT